jgi:hypothetical protein
MCARIARLDIDASEGMQGLQRSDAPLPLSRGGACNTTTVARDRYTRHRTGVPLVQYRGEAPLSGIPAQLPAHGLQQPDMRYDSLMKKECIRRCFMPSAFGLPGHGLNVLAAKRLKAAIHRDPGDAGTLKRCAPLQAFQQILPSRQRRREMTQRPRETPTRSRVKYTLYVDTGFKPLPSKQEQQWPVAGEPNVAFWDGSRTLEQYLARARRHDAWKRPSRDRHRTFVSTCGENQTPPLDSMCPLPIREKDLQVRRYLPD